MGNSHKNKLQKRYREFIKDQRIIVLGIPDEYDYMEPILIDELKKKVIKYI